MRKSKPAFVKLFWCF